MNHSIAQPPSEIDVSMPPLPGENTLIMLSKAMRPGDLCPHCGQEQLDYDGTLNLACPRCGLILGGCFT